MPRALVINCVGLTLAQLGADTPNLSALAARGRAQPIGGMLPAVTSSVQSTYLTGRPPREHGVVANGWYYRDTAEVRFWQQANALVQAPSLWDEARRRDPGFTVANLFWWFNMYSGADIGVTPRPMYPADGRKLPDLYTAPPDLRDTLQDALGRFPLFDFWGPRAGLASSRWIAEAALRVLARERPTLTLVYLPHLDYDLQRFGPDSPQAAQALREVDALCGRLIDAAERDGVRVAVLSEYGIAAVHGAVFPNRVLRDAGLLRWRDELGREQLDAGASPAFAVCDHQIAHVYVNDRRRLAEVEALLRATPGVADVLAGEGRRAAGLDHPRSGDLVLVSEPDRWFAYYWWRDDARAPDYARTVDIHRKPGYDPVELFLDPALRHPALSVAWRLAKRKLGFRTLLDVIPLDTDLVRGSHGRIPADPRRGAVWIDAGEGGAEAPPPTAAQVRDRILGLMFD